MLSLIVDLTWPLLLGEMKQERSNHGTCIF